LRRSAAGGPAGGQYQLHAVRRALAPLPDALKPGFHCVRTHWIRGFMAFELARRTWIVMLMVPV
jgi:hypothetical protein